MQDYLLDIQPGYDDDPVRGVYNHGWVIGDESAISVDVQSRIDALLEIQPVQPGSYARKIPRMAEAEQPERLRHDRDVTVDDVRQLMGASTPHFALQLRNRIRTLIRGLPPEDPARLLGEQEIARLERLGFEGELRGEPAQDGQRVAPLAGRRRAATLRRGPDHRVSLSAGLERAIGLLDPARRPPAAPVVDGYIDLLGGAGRSGGRPAQRLMLTRALPVVYERWWRPTWGRMVMGPLGPGMAGERRIAQELLELAPGDTVLDIACGPGNFVRDFAGAVGKRGLVVGLDASPTMLARAVEDTRVAPNVAYLRGDAVRLPFRDGSFDAICCFAALHLFDEPLAALDAMARVLAPRGRLAILTSARAPLTPAPVGTLIGAATGLRVFGREEITRALEERGFEDVRRRVTGLAQFVGARRAPA